MPLDSKEIQDIVRTLVKERVEGCMSASMMEAHYAAAVRHNVAEFVRAQPAEFGRELLSLCRDEIRAQAKAFVEKHGMDVLLNAAGSAVSMFGGDIAGLVTEEIRKMASQDMGRQIAKRMRQFFAAVDKLAGTQD